MTAPGEKFVDRRTLSQKLMKALNENGIGLATPVVRPEGDSAGSVGPAVARQLMASQEATRKLAS